MGSFILKTVLKILKEQYYDKLISNNSVWYQYIEHMDEQLLEKFQLNIMCVSTYIRLFTKICK